MAKKKSRTVVGAPLTPASVRAMGAFERFPATPADFASDGNWTNVYRVWTCHGYRESGNENQGYLRLQRARSKRSDELVLTIAYEIVNSEGTVNSLRTEVRCRADRRATPIGWRSSSRFVGPTGEPRPELAVEETARVQGSNLEVTISGKQHRRKGSERLALDWGLFEAVGRLSFGEEPALEFDVLEGLSVLKEDQRLIYRGEEPMPAESGVPSLHVFQQTGRGILPYEYWLDDHHRLLAVVTLSRAYILDDDAEQKTRERAAGARKYYLRKRQRAGRSAR